MKTKFTKSKSKLVKRKLSKKKISKKKISKRKIIKSKLRKNSEIPKTILSKIEMDDILKELENIPKEILYYKKIPYEYKLTENIIPYEYKFKKDFFQNKIKDKIIDTEDYRKKLNQLIDDDIILYFIDSTNSSNNKKIYGILKNGSEKDEKDIYLFQFNPLTQYLYFEKDNAPVSLDFYHEEDSSADVDSEKNINTYEIEFSLWQVTTVSLPKINLKNEYTRGEVTIVSTLSQLVMREID